MKSKVLGLIALASTAILTCNSAYFDTNKIKVTYNNNLNANISDEFLLLNYSKESTEGKSDSQAITNEENVFHKNDENSEKLNSKSSTGINTTDINTQDTNIKDNISNSKEESNIEDLKTNNELTNESLNSNLKKESVQEKTQEESKSSDKNSNNSFLKKQTNFTKKKTVILVDKSSGGYCAQAIDYFYEDSNYKYYFTCIKSNSMYVIKNNREYKLVDALNNGIVTIKELEDNGYKFLKTDKNANKKGFINSAEK